MSVCFLAVSRIWVLRETQHICNRGGWSRRAQTKVGVKKRRGFDVVIRRLQYVGMFWHL